MQQVVAQLDRDRSRIKIIIISEDYSPLTMVFFLCKNLRKRGGYEYRGEIWKDYFKI